MDEVKNWVDARAAGQVAQDHQSSVAKYSALHGEAMNRGAAPSVGSSMLPDLLEALSMSHSLEARWQLLVRSFASFGADQLNYGVFELWHRNPDGIEQPPVKFLSTMDADWLDYYGDNRLDLSDVHAMAARVGHFQPYAWGESSAELLELQALRHTQGLVVDAGLRASLHIPLRDPFLPSRAAGSFTIGSSTNEWDFFAGLQGRWSELIAAVQAFHSLALGEVRRHELGNETLTTREVECMSLVAEGRRVSGICDALGLSRSTVDLHLRNARRKLGAATLAEALGRAFATNQVKLR